MDARKIRIVVMLVLAALPVATAILAAHGIVILPLDETGGGLH
jgi:hypothetical protein